jgi:hypothetical protein
VEQNPRPFDPSESAEEPTERREPTRVTQLYNRMEDRLRCSQRRQHSACVKAEKFRRLAKRNGSMDRLRTRISSAPPAADVK